MISSAISRRLIAGSFLFLMVLSSIASARPQPGLFSVDGDGGKLPKVNWIRSRSIDVKHLDIDLRFDWDKEQAIGTTIVTLAPFTDSDTISLDAAMMTIDS